MVQSRWLTNAEGLEKCESGAREHVLHYKIIVIIAIIIYCSALSGYRATIIIIIIQLVDCGRKLARVQPRKRFCKTNEILAEISTLLFQSLVDIANDCYRAAVISSPRAWITSEFFFAAAVAAIPLTSSRSPKTRHIILFGQPKRAEFRKLYQLIFRCKIVLMREWLANATQFDSRLWKQTPIIFKIVKWNEKR